MFLEREEKRNKTHKINALMSDFLTLDRFEYLIKTIPDILGKLTEEEMSHKVSPIKWSKKEILGHLIDSATNNHHRIIRGQFEENPVIVYDQDQWNRYGHYQKMETSKIIDFWLAYNQHLIGLIKRISIENLDRKVVLGGELVTIAYLIEDYVQHLEHHLRQVVH